MDLEFLTGALGALPELGGLSGLAFLAILLLRWQGQTSTRHGEELDRMARLHDADLAEARAESTSLRAQRDAAEERLREVYGLPASPPRPDPLPPPSVSPRPGRRRRDP